MYHLLQIQLRLPSFAENSDFFALIVGQNILDPATAELWVASRIFDRSQSVGDRLGKNEKTKVTSTIIVCRG